MNLRETARRTGVTRLLWTRKAKIMRGYGARPRDHLRYLVLDPELSNFTYEIENRRELEAWLNAAIPGAGRFVVELDGDRELREELHAILRRRPDARFEQPFGRRLGWYALVRAARPAHVVETGTHDGLGSAVLLAALARNREEGAPGRLTTIDPRPGTGWLVPDRLRPAADFVNATSYEALPGLKPDLFLHDSLHTEECERWELETAAAAGASLLVSDNAHATSVLADLAGELGAAYSYFQERPRHWYPGGGIGLARFT